eukprot:CAMPEP_0206042192 /NCGR_PEP_ID=MMETSP1466-20131121/6406_1 /ASSEMBLY_ACC=CAM_ASM_001126 /TAXON_ID=44452 /ORGANISM="Pavlova gyrans, Strain CCMP608" /LENGTH=43 /DNA_ID= /DNA_START= /DNA_END= /DNA_ORIENTATION=
MLRCTKHIRFTREVKKEDLEHAAYGSDDDAGGKNVIVQNECSG